MTDKPIRVGFIGLNPGIHWASMAHIPALESLPNDFVVTGVANTSLASARNAADAFGLPHAFENAQALVDSPEVDLVVVTVKVPHHHGLVTAALNAGKHVYCEWPLGNGLAEAREMADLAETKGVVAAIGTQMRVAPEVEHLRALIADGYVGEVLSTTLVGSGGQWGRTLGLHQPAEGRQSLPDHLIHVVILVSCQSSYKAHIWNSLSCQRFIPLVKVVVCFLRNGVVWVTLGFWKLINYTCFVVLLSGQVFELSNSRIKSLIGIIDSTSLLINRFIMGFKHKLQRPVG